MQDYLFGFTNVDFSFNADIAVQVPESGFLLQLGQTGNDFHASISFSGASGYIFDQSGDLVGGYMKNEAFSISGNYFFDGNDVDSAGRLSYFINDTLIANNVGSTGFIDCIRFEGHTDDTIGNISIVRDTGDFTALMDSEGVYLLSSDDYFLIAKT